MPNKITWNFSFFAYPARYEYFMTGSSHVLPTR